MICRGVVTCPVCIHILLFFGGGFVLEFLFCFVFVLFLGGFAVSSVGVHVPITTVRPCIENAE